MMAVSNCATILIVAVLVSGIATWADAAPPQAAPLPSPLFTAYQSLCLATQGDSEKALAAARGWVEPGADDRLPLGALSMTQDQQRETDAAGVRLHLAVGRAADPAGLGLTPTQWQVCIVSSEVADAGAAPALAAWAEVAPMHGSNPAEGSTLFVVAQSPGAPPRSADGLSDAQIQTLVDRRQIVAVGSNRVGANTILLYARPAP